MLSKTEKRIIAGVIDRLNGARASDPIKAMLLEQPMKNWVKTWLIAPLEIMIDDKRTRDDLKTAEGLAR